MKENLVFLHTGSNLGDRFANLERANQLIEERVGNIVKKSSYYETDAWGITEQPLFINQALLINTLKFPMEVLEEVLSIEQEMGRIRVQKWAERLIDVDMLYFNQDIIETPRLTVPHSQIQNRNFVLAPLAEIAPNWRHPVFQKTTLELLAITKDTLKAKKIAPIQKRDFAAFFK